MCKVGLVLEGGARRGIFTAGVLDYMLEEGISFPYVIGVSAGAGNASGFVSKQTGKAKSMIEPDGSGAYCGVGQLIKSRKLVDTDTMIRSYFYEQIPFDFNTFFNSGTECEFVVTACETGHAEYLSANGSEDRLLTLTKATCSVPFICKPVQIDGEHYLDGSLADSVPAEYALENKCDKVVVVLTRRWETEPPTDYSRFKPVLDISYGTQYPELVDVMVNRRRSYIKQMETLSEYEREGAAYIIRPEGMGIKHFETDTNKVNAYYDHGRAVMKTHMDELCEFLKAS